MATITLPAGSRSGDLQAAINEAASGDVLVLASDMTFSEAVTVPAGLSVSIQSDVNNAWTLTQTAAARHFLVLGSLVLNHVLLNGNALGTELEPQGGLTVTGSLTLTGGARIEACIATDGGAVRLNGGALYLQNGGITRNFASNGGGVAVAAGGVLEMNDGVIEGNTALYGGGAYLEDGEFRLTGGLIGGNSAENQGGGVYVGGNGKLGLSAGTISGNKIRFDSGSGAGVAVSGGGSFQMTGGLIEQNELNLTGNQGGVGGGVAVNGGIFELTRGAISHNRSLQYGAGLGISSGGVCRMSGGWITYNQAESANGGSKLSGGGVAVINGAFYLTGGVIAHNQAVYGGGVYLGYGASTCRLEMSGGDIHDNYTAAYGGGIHCQNAASTVQTVDAATASARARIHDNRSAVYGGGLSVYAASVNLSGVQIANNAAVYGGGISASNNASLTLAELEISANQADQTGGGLHVLEGGSVVLDHAGIGGNRAAHQGGGLWLAATARADIRGGTAIRDNTAQTAGGGVFTGDYDYENPADAAAYQNLFSAPATLFYGNQAAETYEPPVNAAAFTNIGYASSSINGSGGYRHPLNNYDINYAGSVLLELVQVIYDANGGVGGYTDTGIVAGTEYRVLSAARTATERPGYDFAGWNTAADGGGSYFAPGDTFVVSANTTLYAQWTRIEGPFDVIYDANGGLGGFADPGIAKDTSYTIRTPGQMAISRPGYSFVGWNTARDGGGAFYQPGARVVITANLLLYAQWQANPGVY